ncbi:MAG TPA: S53 family peptidase [Janthinobacterium sp.]|nr:S53 family peptidase [Janthinobacterium sp.]
MVTSSSHIVIQGSERAPLANARSLGPVQPDQRIEVTVKLRPPQNPDRAAADAQVLAAEQQGRRTYLTREEFARTRGASAADIAKVEDFARQQGLVVVDSNAVQRSIILSGTAAAYSAAFGAQLEDHEHPNGSYRAQLGPLKAPGDIAGLIEGVYGLDDRPQATPKFQLRDPLRVTATAAELAANTSFTPPQLAKLYDFPQLDGSGQCIGIIELGGGSRPADITAYFAKLGIPAPTVKTISVDHATNSPTTPDSADGEVMLDIEVAGAIAPKALIAVYFAPNTDRGFLDAVTTAIHDQVNKPSVISISWGAAESNWTQATMTSFEQAFADAALLGVTICCASGDNGSGDGASGDNVDFPASAPHALGCGGTKLVVGAGGAITETVWNASASSATGGGFSTVFPVPAYQSDLGRSLSGRGVPDVSGDADPASGYLVRVDGQEMVIGGTSAVAPLWAGLIALLNQQLKTPVGFLNPLLYGTLKNRGVTRDITVGNNGTQQAGPGWDACTGWGSPDGQKLLQALAATPAA